MDNPHPLPNTCCPTRVSMDAARLESSSKEGGSKTALAIPSFNLEVKTKLENRFNGSTRNVRVTRRLAPTLAISLGLGIFSLCGAPAFGQQSRQQRTREEDRPAKLSSAMELSRAFINVAKQAKPTVVHVIIGGGVRQADTEESQRSGPMRPQPGRGTGSGVVVSSD